MKTASAGAAALTRLSFAWMALAAGALFAASCRKSPPIDALPRSPQSGAIADVQFKLELPTGAKEISLQPSPTSPQPIAGHGEALYEVRSGDELLSVRVQVGSDTTLEKAMQFEAMKGKAVLREQDGVASFALSTADGSRRVIHLRDRGVHCTASLFAPRGKAPTPRHTDLTESVCASLQVALAEK